MFLNFACFGIVQVFKFYRRDYLLCRCGCGDKNTAWRDYLLCRCGCGDKNTACCRRCEKNGRGYACENEKRWKKCKFCRFEAAHAPELLYTFLSLLAKSLLGWWIYYNILAIGGKCGEFVAPNATAIN
jgi:hypothetical protein